MHATRKRTAGFRLPYLAVTAARAGRLSLRFLLSMVVGFGVGLLIAAFYFSGGFHALAHMR